MPEYLGKGQHLTFNAVDLSAHVRSVSWNSSKTTAESTAGADEDKTFLAVHGEGSASVTIVAQDDSDAQGIDKGDEASLIHGPEGNTVGDLRRTVNAICTDVKHEHPYDGVVETTFEFLFSGAITLDTF